MTPDRTNRSSRRAPTVDILLATYNGERFLAAQLDSILAQSYTGWRLLIRDDGSTDSTPAIIEDYAARHDGWIVVVDDGRGSLGASGNFATLMEHAQADYVMFCDQDDVWLPHKIKRLSEAMHDLETESGGKPLLVHSDLTVVDERLIPVHPSFWRYQSIDPGFGRALNRLLRQNVSTGCAMLCNRALVELALPIPAEAPIHDWWIALVAGAMGRIAFVDEPTVLYRQHGANTFGAQSLGIKSLLRRMAATPVAAVRSSRDLALRSQAQAARLLANYGEGMDGRTREIVASYATLSERGFFSRRVQILKHRFFPRGPLRTLAFLILV